MKLNIYTELVLTYVFFLLISIFVSGNGGGNEWIKTELAATSFLFAILLAFTITNRQTRLETIRRSLRKADTILLNIYLSASVLGKKTKDECRKKIDDYLIATIDYKLVDHEKSVGELINLFNFIINIDTKKSMVKDELFEDIKELNHVHKEVSHWANEKMHPIKIIILIALVIIMIFSCYYLSDNSLIAIIIIPIISTVFVMLLLIIRDLNSLKWQEKYWIWIPLIDLFNELDLPPYLPDWLFNNKRLSYNDVKGLKKYRFAICPYPYPDMRKTIKIVKNK
jgi:hypothetical protein